MKEQIIEIIAWLVLAGICAILATILSARKQAILALVQDLVQRAEKAVDGSGMGDEKKKLVIAQLEAAGVRMTAWLSKAIDEIVAELNDRDAWYAHLAAGDKRGDAALAAAEKLAKLTTAAQALGVAVTPGMDASALQTAITAETLNMLREIAEI